MFGESRFSGYSAAVVFWGLASAAPAFATGEEIPHDYVALSFTGNGTTPSALEMFEAQARAPRSVDVSVDTNEKGDAGFSYSVPLPPAHLGPQVGLSYSSAAGAHSVLGRGWSLTTGMSISRPTGRAARAYEDVPGVHLIQGEGLDGLLVPDAGGWRYVSSTPGAVVANYDSQSLTWTVDFGGVVRELSPRDDVDWSSGPEPVHWQATHAQDRHGNEVEWTWVGGVLTTIAFGGRPAQSEPHPFEVAFTYGGAPDYPASFQEMGGRIDRIDQRLEAVSVWTFGVHRHEIVISYEQTNHDAMLSSLDQYAAGAWKNLYQFQYTEPDSAYRATDETLPPFLSTSYTAPSWGNSDENMTLSLRELRDVSGDGLVDALDCENFGCEQGWFRWHGPAPDKVPSWEDPASVARTFARPYLDRGLERTENVPIDEYLRGGHSGSNFTDHGFEYGSYTTRAVVDLNGDGFADLLVVPNPDLQVYDVSQPDVWSANLAEGSYTWHAYMGGPDGFASSFEVLQAPFRAVRISRAPWIPGGPVYPELCHPNATCDFSFTAEGAVVDLLDLNGDGWLDVAYASPAGLKVWHFDPNGDWLSHPAVYPEGTGMHVASLSTSRAHAGPDARTSQVLAASTNFGNKPPTHTIHRMEGIKGFMDLNGDGLLDFVDTTSWHVAGTWDVWLGTQAGFSEIPLEWPAPLPFFSASSEGFPWVESCSFNFGVVGDRPPILEQLPVIGGSGFGKFLLDIQGGCSDVMGEAQDVEVMLLDVDGDGRVDLVHANDPSTVVGKQWWRNEGDGFAEFAPDYLGATGRIDLLQTLALPTLGRHHTSQQVIANTNWDHLRPAGAQTAANFGERVQHVLVGDFNGDGLLDSITMGLPWDPDEARYSKGTRPGLLSRVIRGEGAETSLTYRTSATMWPSGTTDVGEHFMGAHRDLVVRVEVSDPVTQFGYEKRYAYEDGYCESGACWGFTWREVEHVRHRPDDTGCSVQLGNTILLTTTEYELSRDHVLPVHELHEIDWSSQWQSACTSMGPLDARFETTYVYEDVGPAAPHARWLTERTLTEHPDPTSANSSTRDRVARLSYDAAGNITEARYEAGPNHPDNIAVEVEYVSDGTGAFFLPKTHRTRAWHHPTASIRVIEEGRFAYDGGNHGDAPTTGDLTTQLVCAAFSSSPCNQMLTWEFDWHPRGLLAEAQGPAGFATYALNPTFGGLFASEERNALLHKTERVFDGMGRVIQSTDPNNVVTYTEYDGFGRIVEESTKGASASRKRLLAAYTYHDDSVPRYVEITRASYNAWGARTTYQEYEVLDGLGRVVQRWRADELGTGFIVTDEVTDLSGAQTYSTYPRTISTFSPNVQSTQGGLLGAVQWRDPFGDLVRSWEDWGAGRGQRVVTYPEPGIVRTTDSEGRLHEARHDVHGRLVEVREGISLTPSDRTAEYRYDGRGRIIRFTDGNSNWYDYSFDAAGRLRTVYRQGASGPYERPYRFSYDGPYPISMRTHDDLSVEWEYDALGRTTEKRVRNPSGGWDTYTWTWDQGWLGARSKTTDPRGSTTYTYAPHSLFGGFGWPTQVTRSYDDLPQDISLSHAYDLAGRVVRTTWPSGRVVRSEYTHTGWLLQQTVSMGTAPPVLAVMYSYDQAGRSAGFVGENYSTHGGTFTTVLGYSGLDRPQSLSWRFNGQVLRNITWEYYPTGQLHEKTIFPPTDAPFVYAYDNLGRVESIHLQGLPLEGFSYDHAGNPATGGFHWHEGSVTYTAPPRFNEVAARSSLHGGDEYFTWDDLSRLSSRTVVPADTTQAPHTFHYAYDGSSRLVEVEREGRRTSAWTLLDYDVDDQVIREHRTDGDFNVEEIYRFEGWRHEAVRGETIEALLPMVKGIQLGGRHGYSWTLTEPDGHALATYSHAGVEVTFEVTGAYGRPLPDVLKLPYNTDLFASAAVWPIESVHGLEQDRHLGLAHAGARHFRTHDGMWLQPEPLLHLGLWNADPLRPLALGGVYAGGDPIGMADREGYYFEIAWDLANVAMGLASLGSNLAEGNYGAAAVDAVGVAADIAGAAVPVVPSGAGTAIRASRAADKAGGLAKGAGASKGGLTPRAARRQAMRDAGIPTSQQPTGQRSVTTHGPDGEVNVGRQLDYEVPASGGGTQQMSVQHSLTDEVPGHGPHWEAGKVKDGGQVDSVGRPRLQNDKAKVDE